MRDGSYAPPVVQVPVGARITWVNRAERANTVETEGVGMFELDREAMWRRDDFDLHTLQPNEAESHVFDRPGTYRYGSSLDATMRGVVEVRSPAP